MQRDLGLATCRVSRRRHLAQMKAPRLFAGALEFTARSARLHLAVVEMAGAGRGLGAVRHHRHRHLRHGHLGHGAIFGTARPLSAWRPSSIASHASSRLPGRHAVGGERQDVADGFGAVAAGAIAAADGETRLAGDRSPAARRRSGFFSLHSPGRTRAEPRVRRDAMTARHSPTTAAVANRHSCGDSATLSSAA